ncbi:MAG: lysine exporter LysO family protein, partial [Anaerovoracaceae bacterium]
MKYIILYWGVMLIGYIIASKLRSKADKFSWIGKLEMLAISTLVFFMGLRMGSNDEVISNLGTIGVQSFVMTIIIMAGAVIAITITRKILKIDKFGVLQTPNAQKKAK